MKESDLFFEHKSENIYAKKNYYKDFFKETFTKKTFIIPAFIIIILFTIGFIFCHIIDLEKHLSINMNLTNIPPCLKYPFGTSSSGQNLFYITFIGVYKTLLLAIIATFINIALGIIFGILWGSNKKANSFFFILKNLVDNIPLIFFYVIIVMFLGNGFIPLLIAIIIFGWVDFAFIIRNTVLIIKTKDYNRVSKLYNVPIYKIAINNYLPSILPILFNNIALSIPLMVSSEVLISYFGFSFGNSTPSLGILIFDSISNSTYFTYPYMLLIPLVFLFIINLCFYLISKTISINSSKEII